MPADKTAPTPTKRLYLFDIDGTLITSGGAGETSFREAVHEVCGDRKSTRLNSSH